MLPDYLHQDLVDEVRKFESQYNARIQFGNEITYWTVDAIFYTGDAKKRGVRKYVTGPAAGGEVLVFHAPGSNNFYTVEEFGKLKDFDAFVRNVLKRLTETRDEILRECDACES
ncbi:MAG: hypothetical protein ABFC24_01770 [Methanoregulaceae archaeon]